MPRATNKGGTQPGAGHPPGHNPIRRWADSPRLHDGASRLGPNPIDWPSQEPATARDAPLPPGSVVPYAHLHLPVDWDFSRVKETMSLLTPDAFRVIAEILRPGSRATAKDQLAAAKDVVLAYAWDKPIVREQRDIRAAVLIQVTSRED